MLPVEFLKRPLAHRGFHDVRKGLPENSHAAILAAMERGFGIEIDVQLTADQQALVFHDYALERLTGARGNVRDRTLKDMSTIPLIGGKSGAPSLAEVLGLVAGAVPLLIELKDQDGALGENVGALEAAVAHALDGYKGPVAVMSFNPHAVSAMQTLAPDVPRGLTTETFASGHWKADATRLAELSAIVDYDRVGACFISHNRRHLGSKRVAELKARGANILCWTVTSPEEEADARKVAENITFERYLPEVPT